MSCCGRGGSWFGTCGGAGNRKVQHTWHEGIRACKAWRQSKAAMGQQLRAARQKQHNESFNDTRMSINFMPVIAFTPDNTPTQMRVTKPISVSTNKSFNTSTTTTIPNSANMPTPTPIIPPTNPLVITKVTIIITKSVDVSPTLSILTVHGLHLSGHRRATMRVAMVMRRMPSQAPVCHFGIGSSSTCAGSRF